jgi:hypothetical protein
MDLRWFPLIMTVGACGAAPSPAPAGSVVLEERVFAGMCDASGAVSLSASQLIAADDEDNVLRVYDVDAGGAPRWSADLSEALDVPLKGKKQPRHPEVDLEAATRIDGRAYWMTSHGRNPKGKLKEERLRFFATTLPERDTIDVVGAYDRLLDDLVADARLDGFALAAAAELPPKEPGGLNIEGLTATPDGELLIGFRNPIPEGRALVIPLRNGAALVEGSATAAELGDPILLDLGGQGIRSLSWWRGRYLIVAGDPAEGGVSWLYTWDGRGAPERVELDLSRHNPEGFFSPEDRDEIMLLSDDGSRLVDGVECKELTDPAQRRFRGLWVRL